MSTDLIVRLAAGLLLAGGAIAAGAGEPADEAKIRQAFADSAAAFNRGDLAGHLAIYDEGVDFMTKDGPRRGIAPIEQAFRERYFRDGRPLQQLAFERLAVRRLTENVAIATARWSLTGGDRPEQAGWFTAVLQRGPDGWRAVHDHSS